MLERIAALCAEAGCREPAEVAHTLGLIIDGAIVAALITRDQTVADTAGRACAAVLSSAQSVTRYAALATRLPRFVGAVDFCSAGSCSAGFWCAASCSAICSAGLGRLNR